ncbi:phytanoyl-CoA dioxygenase family protein [Mucilaginibacter aquaedulcis]|jgi:ectoine hydroxylase-related dioxygenase (phytanoyl-CoA dioxygenase family)|uniref:phytanoyl-CoA dioxygenase family protein n=1 Tax=Mucilaginibacter aquaedulcis TaxID=1187081 RepID=UPI0025B62329|nr:phytanoyl-CoA dioxygenase family protein [Mucilaginibacter aquaedulcis]MDN3549553.1 phytanoyl-CoA dioxygenase family protein [Mucilaginibacter aquaedulcis]
MENRLIYANRTLGDFQNIMDEYGWIVYEGALTPGFIDEINSDLAKANILRRSIQIKNGISANMDGTLHHLLERDNFALSFLDNMYCNEEISWFLNGNYILNGINAVVHARQEHPYLSNMHRDVRTFMKETKLLIQMIVTLDDFTVDNGATYLLSGSHKVDVRPDETYFYEHADRAVAPKGSIIMFNSNLWHAAGENKTDGLRRALTLGFTRPFFKQQMDYPRFLGYDFGEGLSPQLRQVIGYNARTPESLEEYYQPPHLRMYQRDQG